MCDQLISTQQCQCVHSCTHMVNYSGRTWAYQQLGKKGPQHDFVSRSTAASTLCDEQVRADPTGLVAAVRRDNSKKLLNDTEEKTWLYQLPRRHSAKRKTHSSISHQNKLKDQETHLRIPTPHSIPVAILEMLLPNHADVRNLEKVSVHNIFESLAFP